MIQRTNGPSWLDRIDGEWVIIRRQAIKVKRVFELAEKGLSADAMTELLFKERIYSLGGEPTWLSSAISGLLSNEAVTGNLNLGYPEIISADDFDFIQDVLRAKNQSGRHAEHTDNLFHGLLYCACGEKLRFIGNKPSTAYLQCKQAGKKCDAEKHPYQAFEQSVLETVMWIFETRLNDRTDIRSGAAQRTALEEIREDEELYEVKVGSETAEMTPFDLLDDQEELRRIRWPRLDELRAEMRATLGAQITRLTLDIKNLVQPTPKMLQGTQFSRGPETRTVSYLIEGPFADAKPDELEEASSGIRIVFIVPEEWRAKRRNPRQKKTAKSAFEFKGGWQAGIKR